MSDQYLPPGCSSEDGGLSQRERERAESLRSMTIEQYLDEFSERELREFIIMILGKFDHKGEIEEYFLDMIDEEITDCGGY